MRGEQKMNDARMERLEILRIEKEKELEANELRKRQVEALEKISESLQELNRRMAIKWKVE
jgi:hypothetical protein|tara:strand:+ start:1086 stop:1268 length:183 start_codon:yes stop_codon:yes gene_type:complete